MDLRLLVSNVGYTIGIFITLGLGIFVLLKGPRKQTNIFFFLFSLATAVFEFSHVMGVNAPSPEHAQLYFLLNISTLFSAAFNVHWIFSAIGRLRQVRYMLALMYTALLGLTLFYVLTPGSFMSLPVPKLYFPHYYVPGPYYYLGDIFFYSVGAYSIFEVTRTYLKATYTLKNRIKYLVSTLVIGYGLGTVSAFLLYGINVDPLIGSFFWIYTIPLAYAVISDDLLDVHIVAKRAFTYVFLLLVAGFFMIGINYVTIWLSQRAPEFPLWAGSFIMGAIVLLVAQLILRRLREADELKYEFINVVTHKFRTPLTYIKWSTESLLRDSTKEEKDAALAKIDAANMRMVELTNILMQVSEHETASPLYNLKPQNVGELVKTRIKEYDRRLSDRKIVLHLDVQDGIVAPVDHQRLDSVFQVLFDNGIIYNKPGGELGIKVWKDSSYAYVSVSDKGIGLEKEQLKFMFNKFYRTPEATRADTEGMGVGLYIVKNIIERHGGKITVESKGKDRGTTFTVSLAL